MADFDRATNGLRFGCPGCGSGLRYDIGTGKMRCDSCGSAYDLGKIDDPSRNTADGLMDAAEYRCPQCGAAVHTSQTAVTSFCSYCGADVILDQKLTRIRRPDRIVPFRVTREQCEEIYRKRVKEARYAPEDFAAQETVEHFRPVYIPFWQYKGQAQGVTRGTATHYHSDARYNYTDEYAFDAVGSVAVSDVIYDASVSFEDETAQQLGFSVRNARPFHAAYLCGFYAEAPDTDPGLYRHGLTDYARKAWEKEFDRQCKYSNAEVDFFDGSFSTETAMTLMPVWLLAHRSGQRVVYTAVNGDTGDIVCDTPVSNRKFGILAAELTVLALAVLVLLSFAFILRPRLLAALCGLTAAVAQQVVAHVSKNLRIRQNRENDLTWLAAHDRGKKAKRLSRASGCHWYIPVLIAGGVAGVGAVFTWMDSYNYNQFLGSLISEHAWLPPVVMVCALISFLIAGYRRQNPADDTLCALRFLSMALTLAAMFLTVEDMIYYLCSFLMLGLAALSLARLNGAHNAFVSRPVPFFGKEGSET